MAQIAQNWIANLVITLAIGITVFAVGAEAQPNCPPNSVTHTIVRQMVYQGVCCDVEITFCTVPGATPIQYYLLGGVILNPACWGLQPNSPPPFSENFFVSYLRDLIVRNFYPGEIPTCPIRTTVSVIFSTATCAEWKLRVVDLDGPGPLPEVAQYYLSFCSNIACYRECEVCANGNDLDPCTGKPRLAFECGPFVNPGCPEVQQPTNCNNLCGS